MEPWNAILGGFLQLPCLIPVTLRPGQVWCLRQDLAQYKRVTWVTWPERVTLEVGQIEGEDNPWCQKKIKLGGEYILESTFRAFYDLLPPTCWEILDRS